EGGLPLGEDFVNVLRFHCQNYGVRFGHGPSPILRILDAVGFFSFGQPLPPVAVKDAHPVGGNQSVFKQAGQHRCRHGTGPDETDALHSVHAGAPLLSFRKNKNPSFATRTKEGVSSAVPPRLARTVPTSPRSGLLPTAILDNGACS